MQSYWAASGGIGPKSSQPHGQRPLVSKSAGLRWGALLAQSGARAQSATPPKPALPSDPQAGDIVPVALISLVLAFAATLYPSWRASQVNPAEALRYE